MSVYIEYDLEDDTTILIEGEEDIKDGIINASRGEKTQVIKAKKKFGEALKDIKVQSRLLIREIEELHVSEAEIKFGLTTVGELGNLAIGKIGLGVNYEVTLKWKHSESGRDVIPKNQ